MTADRIRARAIRRCGELLQEIKPARGGDRGGGRPSADGNQWEGTRPLVSRDSTGKNAGLSGPQIKQALRVAALPEPEFEAAVEAEVPALELAGWRIAGASTFADGEISVPVWREIEEPEREEVDDAG